MNTDYANALAWLLILVAICGGSILINVLTGRLFVNLDRFGYWVINIGLAPVSLIIVGLYTFLSPDVVGCEFVHRCSSPAGKILEGWLWMVVFPIMSIVVSIPVTMWFSSRRSRK